MKRNIALIQDKSFDLVCVGGGISGAAILREASLRGLKCLLVEKKDFGWATSSATSRLVHGGLRYFKNLEIGLVRESLRERRIMQRIAPYMIRPIPFIIQAPGFVKKVELGLGMVFYGMLGYDKGWQKDFTQKIPGFGYFSADNLHSLEQQVEISDYNGGYVYYDCQMDSPQRLVLEFIMTACDQGALAVNYCEVVDYIHKKDEVKGVRIFDHLSNSYFRVKTDCVVNCKGLWAKGKGMLCSQGIHIITRPLTKSHALIFQTSEGRHFFIIPWRGFSLIGTTDEVFKGEPDKYRVSRQQVVSFLDLINRNYPQAKLSLSDVVHFYGGIRPLVDTQTEQSYSVLRKYEITDHADLGTKGLFTVTGGKITTARNLACKFVNKAFRIGGKKQKSLTRKQPLVAGDISNVADFIRQTQLKYSEFSSAVIQNLCQLYGARVSKLLDLAGDVFLLRGEISGREDHIWAQIIYAVEEEMAVCLDDVIFRRTQIGNLGNPGERTINLAAYLMGKKLKWSMEETKVQINKVLESFTLK